MKVYDNGEQTQDGSVVMTGGAVGSVTFVILAIASIITPRVSAAFSMKWGALQVSVGVTGVLRGPSGPVLVCVGVNAFSQ